MTTSTRGGMSGLGSWRMLAAGAIAAAVMAVGVGCDGGTAPPPAAGTGQNTGPAAIPNQPGSTGPLSGLHQNPTTQLGRSAAMGVDAAQMATNRDAAAAGMAAELSGEAEALDVAGIRWSVPTTWERNRSPGAMRAAEYRIPHPHGGEDVGQAVWFYFGDGQGGTIEDNIARWSTLVRDSGGNPTIPDISRIRINGIQATLIAMEGTYRDGIPGQSFTERPGYGFRGAIYEGPRGNVFIRVTGPADLIEAVLAEWQQVFQSARPDNM